MREERRKLSRHSDVAVAMDYMLKRWDAFACFLDDGRICLTNNAAERALRGLALGRKAWLFARSDRGGERAALLYGLIITAKLNDVDPQAWLADVLAPHRRSPGQPPRRAAALALAQASCRSLRRGCVRGRRHARRCAALIDAGAHPVTTTAQISRSGGFDTLALR
jgi:hypothetical protein